MNWLAIETTGPCVSLALGRDTRVLREVSQKTNASLCIQNLCEELAPDWNILQGCVLSRGPGSYNGLRVGYAFLKGLIMTSPLGVAEIATPLVLATQALSRFASPPATLLILNNARRGEVFGAWVDMSGGLPRMLHQQTVSPNILLDAFSKLPDAIVSSDEELKNLTPWKHLPWLTLQPLASQAGWLAMRLKLPFDSDLSLLEPHYVRAAVPSLVRSSNPQGPKLA